MIGLASKKDYQALNKRVTGIPPIFEEELQLKGARARARRDVFALRSELTELKYAKPYDKAERDKIKERKAQINEVLPKAVAMWEEACAVLDEFIWVNKDDLVYIDESKLKIVGVRDCVVHGCVTIENHAAFTSRSIHRWITLVDTPTFVKTFAVRDWEINGFPEDMKKEEKQRLLDELDEILYPTVVLSPGILRESRNMVQAIFNIVLHEKRNGLCWLLSRCVLYEFMDYARKQVAESIGLYISAYRPTASCITEKEFWPALKKNGSVAKTMPLFKGYKVVINRALLDAIIFRTLGIKVKPEKSDITYLIQHKPIKQKELKINKKVIE